jgi:hypothetical protein
MRVVSLAAASSGELPATNIYELQLFGMTWSTA